MATLKAFENRNLTFGCTRYGKYSSPKAVLIGRHESNHKLQVNSPGFTFYEEGEIGKSKPLALIFSRPKYRFQAGDPAFQNIFGLTRFGKAGIPSAVLRGRPDEKRIFEPGPGAYDLEGCDECRIGISLKGRWKESDWDDDDIPGPKYALQSFIGKGPAFSLSAKFPDKSMALDFSPSVSRTTLFEISLTPYETYWDDQGSVVRPEDEANSFDPALNAKSLERFDNRKAQGYAHTLPEIPVTVVRHKLSKTQLKTAFKKFRVFTWGNISRMLRNEIRQQTPMKDLQPIKISRHELVGNKEDVNSSVFPNLRKLDRKVAPIKLGMALGVVIRKEKFERTTTLKQRKLKTEVPKVKEVYTGKVLEPEKQTRAAVNGDKSSIWEIPIGNIQQTFQHETQMTQQNLKSYDRSKTPSRGRAQMIRRSPSRTKTANTSMPLDFKSNAASFYPTRNYTSQFAHLLHPTKSVQNNYGYEHDY